MLSFIVAMVLLLLAPPGVCQETPAAASMPGLVNSSTLEAKIASVDAATDMNEEAKKKLTTLYRKALSNLQTAGSNAQAAEDFRQMAATAPVEIQAVREAIEKGAALPPEDSLNLDSSATLREIEQLLRKEKADLAAVDAKRADREKHLEAEAGRPELIQQRLIDAQEQQEEVALQLRLSKPAEEGSASAEARVWVLETDFDVLSTEIEMLDQELLSQPMRLDLLKAERDRAAASVQWVKRRVRFLEEMVSNKRHEEAAQAKAEAEAIRRETEGGHPLVAQLAEQNAALAEEFARSRLPMDDLVEQTATTASLTRSIETDFKQVKDAIEAGGLSRELGYMLLRQRQSLPDPRTYHRAAKEQEEQAAEISVRRLRHQQEATRLHDLDAYVAEALAETTSEHTSKLREQLRGLALYRKDLLKAAIDADDVYLRSLGKLESNQRRLMDTTRGYGTFLDEHLLWVRSTSLFQLGKLGIDYEEMWQILSPGGWFQVVQTFAYQATHSPIFLLFVAASAILFWGRGRLIALIRDSSAKLGKPAIDRFGYSLLALGLTLITAAAWPLLMGVAGWQLKGSVEGTDFTNAVGVSLLSVAVYLYHLRALRLACIPGGLGAAHFRWREASLRPLRTELDRLTWVFLPAAFWSTLAWYLDPLDEGWAAWRLLFLVATVSLALAFYRLLHPERGILVDYLRGRQKRTVKQLYRLAYPLVVLFPLALGVLSLMGYRYSAGALTELLLETVWFVVSLFLLFALSERWLLVTRRRLAYDAAMEGDEAKAEDGRVETARNNGEAAAHPEAEEAETDVIALSETSRKMMTTAIFLYGLFGLWFIWSDVFPALRILDQITLWHQTVTVDGDVQVLPITLASLGKALLYGAITVVLAKQLPAVLEILLLQYTGATAGGRYTITTLTNYAIVTSGVVLAFKTIGADWSQLQWLVAAMGVGIGFGLQEIVANFISGIIILFERPIRIGDVVTVGDTDGTVARIRSRATTIRSWDGKELLVPNKEFITGRLLNWSLSDQATRIVLSVGIAYGSNVRDAMRLLEEAAEENENVLDDPAPSVVFETFGDNSLGLLLRCFVDSTDLRYPTMSELNEVINDKFTAAGIVIAFPQMDLHLDTSRPLQVELHSEKVVSPDGRTGEAAGRSMGEN